MAGYYFIMNPRWGYGSFVVSQVKTFSSTTRHLQVRDVNRRSKQAVRHSFITQTEAACLVVSDATKRWEKTYPIDATTVATRSGRTVTLLINIAMTKKKSGTRRKQYRFKSDDVAERFVGRLELGQPLASRPFYASSESKGATVAVAAPIADARGGTQGPGLDPATRRRIAAPESKTNERRMDANITSTRVLNITVDIGRGRPPQEIHVHDDDVHLELAHAFVAKHGLVSDMVPILCSHITTLVDRHTVSLETTGAAATGATEPAATSESSADIESATAEVETEAAGTASVSVPSAVETTAADVAAGETEGKLTTGTKTRSKGMKDTGGTTSTKDAAGTKDKNAKQRTVVIGAETQDVLGLRDVEHAREVMTHLSVASFKTDEKTGALRLCFSDRKHRVEALVWIQGQVMILKTQLLEKARLREDETEMTDTEDEGEVVKEEDGGKEEPHVGGMDKDTNVDVRLFYYGIGCIPPLPDAAMAVAEPSNTKARGGSPAKHIIDAARATTTARLTLEMAAPFVEAAGILDSRHFYYCNTPAAAVDYTCNKTSVGIQKNGGGTRPPVIDTTKRRPKPSTGRVGEDNGENQEEVSLPLPAGDAESGVAVEAVARPAQQSPDQGWSGLRTWQEKRAGHRRKSESSPRAKHMERSQSLNEEIAASPLSNRSPSPKEPPPCVIIAKEDGNDRHQQKQRKQTLQDRQTQHEEQQVHHSDRLQHDDDSSMYSSEDEDILQRIVNANTEVALAAAMEALAASSKLSTKKDRGDGEGGNEDGGDEAEEKQLDFNEAVAVSRTKMAQDHSIWSARVARLFRQYLMGHSLARAALAADEESRRSSAAFRRSRQPVAQRRQTMNSDGEETDSSVMSSHLGEQACGGDVSEDISVESSRLVHIMGDDISVASSIQNTAHSTVLDDISVTSSFQSTLLDDVSVASDRWLKDDPILGRMFRDTEAALLSAIPATDGNGDHDGDGGDGSDGDGGGGGGDTSASGVIGVDVASDDGGGGGRRSGGGAVGTMDTGASTMLSPVETRRLMPREEEATKKRESPKVNFAHHGRVHSNVHSTKLGRKLLNLSKKHNAEWGSTLTTLSAVGKLMGPVRRMRARNALNGVSGGDREVGRASGGVVPEAMAAEGDDVDETKLATNPLAPHGADECGASPLGSGGNTGASRDLEV